MRDGVGGEVQAKATRVEHLALVVLAHGDFQKVHRAFHNHALHRRRAGLVVVVTLRQRNHVALRETVERKLGAHRESATKRRRRAGVVGFGAGVGAEPADAGLQNANHGVALQHTVAHPAKTKQGVSLTL